MGKLKLGKTLTEIAENADFTINFIIIEHRKKRKTRKCKLKLGKILAEKAEGFGQAKAWFYLLAENAENADFAIHSQ